MLECGSFQFWKKQERGFAKSRRGSGIIFRRHEEADNRQNRTAGISENIHLLCLSFIPLTMPKLYSSNEIIKVLQERGFIYISQKGSHIKFRKIGAPALTVIIPADKEEIPSGTFKSILRQADLIKEDFEKK